MSIPPLLSILYDFFTVLQSVESHTDTGSFPVQLPTCTVAIYLSTTGEGYINGCEI